MPDASPTGAIPVALVHLLFIAWGLVDIFLGYRVFRWSLALVGVLGGGALGLLVAEYLIAPGSGIAAIIGLVLGGVVGAMLVSMVFQVAVFLAGAAGGAFAAIAVLGPEATQQVWPLAVGAIIGALVFGLIKRPAIITAMALAGGARVALGLGYFVGGSNLVLRYLDGETLATTADLSNWLGLLALGLALSGIFKQLLFDGKKAQELRNK